MAVKQPAPCPHLTLAHSGSIYACMDCGLRGEVIRKLFYSGVVS